MLTVIATIRSKKGAEENVRQQLVGLVAPTRTENGCVDYILYQDQSDPSTLMFYENWESKTDLDAHMKSPHFKKCFAEIVGLFDIEVHLLTELS